MKRKLIKRLLTKNMHDMANIVFKSEIRKNDSKNRRKLERQLNDMLLDVFWKCGVIKTQHVWVNVSRNPHNPNDVILTAMFKNQAIKPIDGSNSVWYLLTADSYLMTSERGKIICTPYFI